MAERPAIDTTLPHGKVFTFMPIPIDHRHAEWVRRWREKHPGVRIAND